MCAQDSWEICLFLLGYAGTGKSSVLKLVRELFELQDVGVLSNNLEQQWALSSLHDKYVVLGYEIKQNFKWEQAEFQSCVTGEEVSVAVKFKTAFVCKWMPHILMAGNEMVTTWRDNGGSLARRLLLLKFVTCVPKDKANPNLGKLLRAEIPYLLQKFNRAYIEATNLYHVRTLCVCFFFCCFCFCFCFFCCSCFFVATADVTRTHARTAQGSDLWAPGVLPEYFHELQRENMEVTHPLQAFLKQVIGPTLSGVNEDTGEKFFCQFDEFVRKFREFCKRESRGDHQFNEHFYGSIFARNDLQIETTTKFHNNNMVTDRFIIGCALTKPVRGEIRGFSNNGHNGG